MWWMKWHALSIWSALNSLVYSPPPTPPLPPARPPTPPHLDGVHGVHGAAVDDVEHVLHSLDAQVQREVVPGAHGEHEDGAPRPKA